jgi:nucleoid DNA-binding protein
MATDKSTKTTAIREAYTKAQLLAAISEETGLNKKEVGAVLESLGGVMHRHLKKRGAGAFTLPGLAKFTVTTKKATKARKGINPFTGQETVFQAKPARRVIKVRPLTGLKEMADS